jgi:hypothetical protein
MQQFYTDRAQCSAMSGGSGPNQIAPSYGGGFNNSYNTMSAIMARKRSEGIFNDCMYGRGWQLVPADE